MRLIFTFLFCFSILFNTYGQVTNLTVNGVSSDFSMISGDEFSWSYNVPLSGDTTMLEFWIDADNNGGINEGDVPWVYFNQIDGDNNGQNGPPDMDGEVNGHVSFQQELGLAPGNYILSFNNSNSPVSITGNIAVLPSPLFTISGNILTPPGLIKKNIVVSVESNSENGTFWTALTDANGDFSIYTDSNVTLNQWRLRIENKFVYKSAVITPEEILLNLDSSVSKIYSGNEFIVTAASAEINGNIIDEYGNPVVNTSVNYNSSDGGFYRYVNTDNYGDYYIGLLSNDLPQLNLSITAGDYNDSTTVKFNYRLPVISLGDTLIQNIIFFKTNSIIEGRFTLNGNSAGINDIIAECADAGYIRTSTDEDGYYRFYVSDKIYNYTIKPGQQYDGYTTDSIVVHPGDLNANLNLTTTGIENSDSEFPNEFSISQNYPNPFNPSTLIKYQVPENGFVTLKVFDLLGNEIKTLISEEKNAGSYEIKFDAYDLTSGIYFYKMSAGNFNECRKMILLK